MNHEKYLTEIDIEVTCKSFLSIWDFKKKIELKKNP
jgi:hypothetical protein